MSGTVQRPPVGARGIIHTHYQQLPIKDRLFRWLVQPLIEKGIAHNVLGMAPDFQHRLALLRH